MGEFRVGRGVRAVREWRLRMAERGRAKPPLELSEEERQTLERLTNRRTTAQALALRARIILACAEAAATNRAVAARLGVHAVTVGKWWARFVARRLEVLFDESRPGAKRTVTDDVIWVTVSESVAAHPGLCAGCD